MPWYSFEIAPKVCWHNQDNSHWVWSSSGYHSCQQNYENLISWQKSHCGAQMCAERSKLWSSNYCSEQCGNHKITISIRPLELVNRIKLSKTEYFSQQLLSFFIRTKEVTFCLGWERKWTPGSGGLEKILDQKIMFLTMPFFVMQEQQIFTLWFLNV